MLSTAQPCFMAAYQKGSKMACYYPVDAWRHISGKDPVTRKWPLTFKKQDANLLFPLKVPCGRCIGCRLERSRQWAIRCIHEASLHTHNQFITLTYDNESLDKYCGIYDEASGRITSYSLNKKDFQKFMKRMRKHYGKIRFMHCGEYGESFGRPHHHACMFGLCLPDKQLWKVVHGVKLYTSPKVNEIWGRGYCVIGEVTFESAAYVSRYITKKINGVRAPAHYDGREPEYITMSRRPGIAHDWFKKYQLDVLSQDAVILRGGLKLRPPKYYDKLYEDTNPDHMESIKRARKNAIDPLDSTPDRLHVKEKIARSYLQTNPRRYENESVNICRS